MRRIVAALTLLLVMLGGPPVLRAQSPKQVKVLLEYRQAAARTRDAVQGSGRVVITERGSARPSARVAVESTERQVTQSTGIFTIVQDGGESRLVVASQVPYPQVAYYRDYLTGAGHLAAGVAFQDVGTSLTVRASVLPENRVRVRLTPTISWMADRRSGIVEVSEASTDLVVPHGRPVVIGGATGQLHELTRQILGVAERRSRSETLMTLTVTVLD